MPGPCYGQASKQVYTRRHSTSPTAAHTSKWPSSTILTPSALSQSPRFNPTDPCTASPSLELAVQPKQASGASFCERFSLQSPNSGTYARPRPLNILILWSMVLNRRGCKAETQMIFQLRFRWTRFQTRGIATCLTCQKQGDWTHFATFNPETARLGNKPWGPYVSGSRPEMTRPLC